LRGKEAGDEKGGKKGPGTERSQRERRGRRFFFHYRKKTDERKKKRPAPPRRMERKVSIQDIKNGSNILILERNLSRRKSW